jgi:hypothetical protein
MWQASEGLIAILVTVFVVAFFSKSSRKPSKYGTGGENAGVAANLPSSPRKMNMAIDNAALGTTTDFVGEANHVHSAKNLD